MFWYAVLCCLHGILPWHLETSQPDTHSSSSHPPRILLASPHTTRTSTHVALISLSPIPCMHHARVHREHRESCTYNVIHSRHFKDNTTGYRGPAPGPPLMWRASSYTASPIHLSTSFTHHSEKHSHTHSSIFAHTLSHPPTHT